MAGARGVLLAPLPQGLPRAAWLFGEDQGRYLIETGEPETVLAAARVAAIPARVIGVVGGVALLLAFGRTGVVGRLLDSWFGLTIPFTPVAVVMAETFVAMPFLIISVEGALRSADQGFEEAAATLGAKRMMVFSRVTLPMIAPSVGAGAVLCWARALGEFGATITFAGNLPGRTQTMPLAIYISQSSGKTDEAIALSLILVLVSLVVMIFRRQSSRTE